MQKRLPRFKRTDMIASLHLTERDHHIIRLVHRHRFLRSNHFVSLLGGSRQQLLRRLQLLYHHGYLERPRAQLQYYDRTGSQHMAYGLGKKGGELLRQEHGLDIDSDAWNEKNHTIGRLFLEHALFVSDIMICLELACRKHGGVKLLYADELPLRSDRQPFRWRVTIQKKYKLGVIPDQVFALEYVDQNGQSQRVYFFLEADRGTMPVTRRTLAQSSFARKLLAYEATWTQNIHRQNLDIQRFRVLTVTTSATRVKSLVEACSQLERGHGLFLFADKSILSGDLLAPLWQTGRPGEMGGLLQ